MAASEVTNATTQPVASTSISPPPNTPPPAKNLTTFSPEAPAITGMAKKKVKRLATLRLMPSSRPPMMVAPLRLVPGTSASTCHTPTIRASR